MRGQLQCRGSILQALEAGPLFSTELRIKTAFGGSVIYKHITSLLEQKLITDWTSTNLPYRDRRYFRITPRGRQTLALIQLTLDMLGLPDLTEYR